MKAGFPVVANANGLVRRSANRRVGEHWVCPDGMAGNLLLYGSVKWRVKHATTLYHIVAVGPKSSENGLMSLQSKAANRDSIAGLANLEGFFSFQ